MGSEPSDRYYMPLPVWTGGNVYFNGAKPADIEQDYTVDTEHEVYVDMKEEDGEWKLSTNVRDFLPKGVSMITTDTLGMAFEPEQRFENPDGSDIIFDTDIDGVRRSGDVTPGPWA